MLAALKRRGVDAHAFDPSIKPVHHLVTENFDRAWIALHGPGGEDGVIQGALEWLGVPYTGSGVLASALTMDKLKTKRVVVGAGYLAPEYAVLTSPADLAGALASVGLPLMVKPASQGSSLGITKVKEPEQFARAYDDAHAVDTVVFAERFITGDEYTVGVLHTQALPSIRIQPATEFYDYQAKYFRNDTQYHCPSGLTEAAEAELQAAALAAFQVTHCFGWGRVDFMRDPITNKFYFIEINTTPGMTDHSLVPMAARQAGIDFDELVWRVLETSFARIRKMNLQRLLRRNRFKKPAKTEKAKRQWPAFVREWRTHARRAALLLLIGGALAGLSWALDRPIRVISMDGAFQRVSPGDIEKAVAPYTQAGFMSADLDRIERAVESVPWVDHARVQRRFPNSLHVTVVEETAAARWGESGLLNTRGELFVRAVAHVPAELPRLSGPDGTESQVAQRYLVHAGPDAGSGHAHRRAAPG